MRYAGTGQARPRRADSTSLGCALTIDAVSEGESTPMESTGHG